MGQVDGKIAIVTGGASGIGAACAATLAREGAEVVLCQEGARAPCCTRDEGGPFGAVL